MCSVVIKADEFEEKTISKVLNEFEENEPVVFNNFSQAKEFLEEHIVDVVFLNIVGQKACWEAQCDLIKSIDRVTKIVLISDNRMDAVKAFDIDALDFLLVPISESGVNRVARRARVS